MNQNWIAATLRCGAEKAAFIDAETIVLSDTFRDVCRTGGCGGYDRCWMCPPHIGEIHELMARVRSYHTGLLYQTIGEIEDSFDIEGMQEVGLRHAQVSQAVEAALKAELPAHLHLSCGGCHLCPRCARLDDQPCRHPDTALPPMEGYGIDVYRTCKPTALKYVNGQNTVTYFGLILF